MQREGWGGSGNESRTLRKGVSSLQLMLERRRERNNFEGMRKSIPEGRS